MRKVEVEMDICLVILKNRPEDCGERGAMKASDSPTLTGCSVELILTSGTGT